MARTENRIHRLPKRMDYTLIPAPLDLSLPLAVEKSLLPAIIVTPSSPSLTSASETDSPFFIAFLAPPPKPTMQERLLSYLAPFQLKLRTILILMLLTFIMMCHLLAHRLATSRPRLEFETLHADSGSHASRGGLTSALASWLDAFWASFGVSSEKA